jgi:hypothetical protein
VLSAQAAISIENAAVYANLKQRVEKEDTRAPRGAEAAYASGMAEVALDILHNIGNVITSIGVSVDYLKKKPGAALLRHRLCHETSLI